jgi:hypothetical protein
VPVGSLQDLLRMCILPSCLHRSSFDELGIMATNPDSVWSLDNFAEIKMLRVEIQSRKAAVQRLAKANLARRPDIEQLMQESRHSVSTAGCVRSL